MSNRLPLIVILGATGSGKTKLSLELAKKFSGEVIGADSMQMYKGLDIITAKATKEEQTFAPHHMIDILQPHEIFTVVDYRNRTLKIIDDLFSKNKLPIIVGGTNYYIESILWKILVAESDKTIMNKPGILPNNDHELPSEELHKKLKLLDPAMAQRLHPNNKRKILRSLEVLHQQGKTHSEVLEEQHSSEGGCRTGGGLRYPNSLVLWLQSEQNILNDRLNSRVDSMISQGLVDELTNFHKNFNTARINTDEKPDYTTGIFQSIGFKEFHPFLMLSDDEKTTEEGKRLLEEGVEQLKLVTRRFSRKQNKWVTNRFLGRTDRQVPPVFGLDTTDVSQWNNKVTVPSFEIVQSFISNTECKHERLPFRKVNSTPNSEDKSFLCEVCDRVFVGDFQWLVHIKSHKHKKMIERRARLKKQGIIEDKFAPKTEVSSETV